MKIRWSGAGSGSVPKSHGTGEKMYFTFLLRKVTVTVNKFSTGSWDLCLGEYCIILNYLVRAPTLLSYLAQTIPLTLKWSDVKKCTSFCMIHFCTISSIRSACMWAENLGRAGSRLTFRLHCVTAGALLLNTQTLYIHTVHKRGSKKLFLSRRAGHSLCKMVGEGRRH